MIIGTSVLNRININSEEVGDGTERINHRGSFTNDLFTLLTYLFIYSNILPYCSVSYDNNTGQLYDVFNSVDFLFSWLILFTYYSVKIKRKDYGIIFIQNDVNFVRIFQRYSV